MSRVKYNGFFMGRLITEADVYIFFWIKRGVLFFFFLVIVRVGGVVKPLIWTLHGI